MANDKNELWSTWHDEALDQRNGMVTIRNTEGAAWLYGGGIVQANEQLDVHITEAFKLCYFEGRRIEIVMKHWTNDPMIEWAARPENAWPKVTSGNEHLPSIQRAVADHGKTSDGTTNRDEFNWYIEDSGEYVMADVLQQFNDFFTGRAYLEGEGRLMYPEEYERAAMLGLACERAVRMKVTAKVFTDFLAWHEPAKKSTGWTQQRTIGQYFLAEPSHAKELQEQGMAVTATDAEWDKAHPKRKTRIEGEDAGKVAARMITSGGFQRWVR